MDWGELDTLVNDTVFGAFSVSGTVTRPAPDDTPITATLVWQTPTTEELFGGQHREPKRVIVIRRDQVPTVPRGTQIVAPLTPTGTPQPWRVDGLERLEDSIGRYLVIPDPDPNSREPEL